MISASVILGLMGLATKPWHILALRLLQGMLTGTVAASTALVATTVPKQRLGFGLGLIQVAMFGGSSLGPLFGGIIADHFGFRASFGASCLLALAGGLTVITLVQEDFTPPQATAKRRGVIAESRVLLALAGFPAIIVVIFLIQFGNTIIAPVLSLFIKEELAAGADPATMAGLVMGATGAVSATAALLLGRYGDKVGFRALLPVCLLGSAIAYIPQAFVHRAWQLLVLRMILGAFLGGLMPTANALLARRASPDQRGAAFGLAATSNSLGFAAGPLSGAFIATHLGMRAVFLATAAMFLAGWVVVAAVFRGKIGAAMLTVGDEEAIPPLPPAAPLDSQDSI
jgi:DHA1 family multidrug resistance protein-like MFS transporter